MRPETAAALYDMSRATARIAEATSAKTYSHFDGDWYFQSAIERQFEILGEALVRIRDLETPVFEMIPDAHKIVGLRTSSSTAMMRLTLVSSGQSLRNGCHSSANS